MELIRGTSTGGLHGDVLSGRAEKYMSCAVPVPRSEANAISRSSSSVAGAMSLPSLLSSVTSVGADHAPMRLARDETQMLFPFLLAGRALVNQIVRPSSEMD